MAVEVVESEHGEVLALIKCLNGIGISPEYPL